MQVNRGEFGFGPCNFKQTTLCDGVSRYVMQVCKKQLYRLPPRVILAENKPSVTKVTASRDGELTYTVTLSESLMAVSPRLHGYGSVNSHIQWT